MFKKSRFVLIYVIFFIICVINVFAQESVTITTYYPSPYGSYNELRTYSNTYLATDSGNVGIGTTGPTFSIGRGLHISGVAGTPDAVIRLSEQTSALNNFEVRSTARGTSGNRLEIGEGSDTFLTIRSDDDGGGTTSRGNVGIGTTAPATRLHISGATPQLRISGDAANTGGSFGIYELGIRSWLFDNPAGANSTLNIYDYDDLQANLRNDASAQNDDGWVTAAIDYGEFMEKLNYSEDIKPFEVVGIKNGKVTKDTKGATLYMITSSDSGIRGGNPIDSPREKDANYIVVAYAGQVPVLVDGEVKEGDYLLPSGKNDGKAVAVSSDKVDFETYRKSIGVVLNIVDEDFYKDFDFEKSDGGWEKELKNFLGRKGKYTVVNVAVGVK